MGHREHRTVTLFYQKAHIPDWLTEDELRQALDSGALSAVITPFGDVELQANFDTPGDWFLRLKEILRVEGEPFLLYRGARYTYPGDVDYDTWFMIYHDRALLTWCYNRYQFETVGGLNASGYLTLNFPAEEDEEEEE